MDLPVFVMEYAQLQCFQFLRETKEYISAYVYTYICKHLLDYWSQEILGYILHKFLQTLKTA